jgi:hypothetical protein
VNNAYRKIISKLSEWKKLISLLEQMQNTILIGNPSLCENDCFCARFSEREKTPSIEQWKLIFLIEVNEKQTIEALIELCRTYDFI